MLQDGVDIAALSYDELLSWAARVNREQGGRKLGFPAAQDGLLRRFLQGYAYPSFTGRLHARFKSADAVTMWKWMRRAWAESNPRSPTYAFMHKPLQSGEVWIAWDHVARLIEALKAGPEEFVAFPAPTGPRGLGYITVPSGLAVGLPVAVSFWGTAGSEANLVEIAHGYERARDRDTGPLPPPMFEPFV